MSVEAQHEAASAAPAKARRGPGGVRLAASATTWGVLLVFLLLFTYFSVTLPDSFLATNTMASILNSSVIDALIAAGLVFPLIMNDFDLSVGSMASLSGAAAVILVSQHNLTAVSAVSVALLIALLVGLVNGVLVAGLNASSFIVTLAMGSVLTGVEFLLTEQQTVVDNIPVGYTSIGSTNLGGVILPVFIVVALVAIATALLRYTPLGRSIYAVGSNIEASRLAGVATTRLRIVGLVISAVAAGVAGIFITSVASSSFPNAGAPHLLPTFAAAFLGSVLFPHRRFSVVAAALAAVLLQMVSTGLVMSNFESWTSYVFNGAVLLLAVLISVRARRVA